MPKDFNYKTKDYNLVANTIAGSFGAENDYISYVNDIKKLKDDQFIWENIHRSLILKKID